MTKLFNIIMTGAMLVVTAVAIFALGTMISRDHHTPHGTWCSGSGQGPVDCPHDYYRERR